MPSQASKTRTGPYPNAPPYANQRQSSRVREDRVEIMLIHDFGLSRNYLETTVNVLRTVTTILGEKRTVRVSTLPIWKVSPRQARETRVSPQQQPTPNRNSHPLCRRIQQRRAMPIQSVQRSMKRKYKHACMPWSKNSPAIIRMPPIDRWKYVVTSQTNVWIIFLAVGSPWRSSWFLHTECRTSDLCLSRINHQCLRS